MSSETVESQIDNGNSLKHSAVKNSSEPMAMKSLGEKRELDFESKDKSNEPSKRPAYHSEWLMRRPPVRAPDSYAVTARRQIVHLIKDKKYKDAWRLLLAVVETDRVSVYLLWEIGLLLTKKLELENPADYLRRVYVSCVGPKATDIFVAWVQELMRQERLDEAYEHVKTHLEGKGNGSHPGVLRLFALLYTRSCQFNSFKGIDPSSSHSFSSSTKSMLLEAYHAYPDDPDVSEALLMFLRDSNSDQTKNIAQKVLSLGSSRNDVRLMRMALKYYQPPIEPFNAWLKLMLPLHLADPSTDPDIYGKIYYGKMIHTRQHTTDTGMQKYALRCILSFVFDRLEVGCHDEWTLDVLESSLKKLSRNPSMLLIRMFEDRKILQKILEIQPEDPVARDRLLDLHKSIARCQSVYHWLRRGRSAQSLHTRQ
ncbi:hypothetical protein BX666DRAFT_721377 [Dichotomocladium elegans]|nr:hypothetical protein BX666DRAFT_721377 [Dichotomocladium elegans]